MAHAHRHRRAETPPAETIGLRAAQVIEHQRGEIRAHLGTALDGRDPEGVHDMRVASRRLRACLQVFAPWIEGDDLERTEDAVRTVTRALGRVREFDVMRLRLAELRAHARPERALAIEAVDSRLEQRRGRARARMMSQFAKVDLDRLDHRLRRLVAHLETSGKPRTHGDDAGSQSESLATVETSATSETDPRPHASAPTAELVRAATPDVATALRDALGRSIPDEVGGAAAAEELHQVRIAAKKLRYLLEILAPYLGDAGPALIRRLKDLQDDLGNFHDDVVLDAELAGAVERASERDRSLLARELRRFRSLRRRALNRDERKVRQTIARLGESGFESEVLSALGSAVGATSETEATSAELGDAANDAQSADEPRDERSDTTRRRAATMH